MGNLGLIGRLQGIAPQHVIVRLIVCGLLGLSPVYAPADGEAKAKVTDPRYGVSLYYYFQHDYLSALSELQVADSRGGIQGHDHSPAVLRGAMSLAFGLDRSATEIFNQVLHQHSAERVRNAAWFYLARMRLRRGDWAAASASVNRIQGEIDPDLLPELQAMRVNLAIRSDQLDKAAAALDSRGGTSEWRPYLYYNLGTAYIRSARIDTGLLYLDRLGTMKLGSAEHRAIRDKGLTAAGYSLMSQQDYAAAVDRFEQVRLDSPIIEQALLGYGWSATEMGDFERALGPWQMLAARSPVRPAVQEALLAVPYAYEKLDALGSALQEFETAEAIFTAQIDRLDAMKATLGPRTLLHAVNFDEGLSPALEPSLAALIELLSGSQFQLYRRNFQDLDALNRRLHYWRTNIDIYRSMLLHRQTLRRQKLASLEQADYPARLQRITARREHLARELELGDATRRLLAIADVQTRQLWSRVERAGAALARLRQAGEDMALEQAQLDRYRGLLLWRLSERSADWQWQVDKRQAQLDLALATAETSMRRLQQVIDEVPDITPYQQRLSALEQRVQRQSAAVEQSFQSTGSALQELVVRELNQQQARLRYYQSQARLASARLYDRARLEAAQ